MRHRAAPAASERLIPQPLRERGQAPVPDSLASPRPGASRLHPATIWARASLCLGVLVAASAWPSADAYCQDSDAVAAEIKIGKMSIRNETGLLDSRFFTSAGMSLDQQRLTNVDDCPVYNNETGEGDDCNVDVHGYVLEIQWDIALSVLQARDTWSAKIGTSCTTDAVGGESETCAIVAGPAAIQSANNQINIELARLIGTLGRNDSEDDGATRSCCGATGVLGTQGDVNLKLYFGDDESGTDAIIVVDMPFRYDYKAPSVPTNVSATSNGTTVDVSWDKVGSDAEADLKYRIYYAQTDFTNPNSAAGSKEVNGTVSSTSISGLEVGATYYFRVSAVDDADNESALSEADLAGTIPTRDGFQYYKELGGVDDGGYCFVATAAFGSYLDPHVEILRHVRDRMLMQTGWGREFVAYYYEHGGDWAAWIAERGWARGVVRAILLPIVAVSWFAVEIGLLGKLAVLSLFALVAMGLRRATRRVFWTPAGLLPAAQAAPVQSQPGLTPSGG